MTIYNRSDGRADNELRPLKITPNYTKYAEGSVLVCCGNTKVICTASIENKVPNWLLDDQNSPIHGWITAEYGMLPRSTGSRRRREIGSIQGRTHEIQRLIGRSLRSVTNLHLLKKNTIWIDCDVIQADGGTRTTSINGGFVALIYALRKMHDKGDIEEFPVKEFMAATSVGIVKQKPVLDLNYDEDKDAEVDMNVVMINSGKFVEIQGTAEGKNYSREQLNIMLDLAEQGIRSNIDSLKKVLGNNLTI